MQVSAEHSQKVENALFNSNFLIS